MKTMSAIVTIIGIVFFVMWAGVRVYKSEVTYVQGCGGHLKRAADANTIELAKEELKTALVYIEQNGLTSGYTSVIWQTPDEDVGFWYRNLKKSLGELERCEATCKSQLEETNVLMKLRETLLDEGAGVTVTNPAGISVFPNNTFYMWWALGSFALAVIVTFGILASDY